VNQLTVTEILNLARSRLAPVSESAALDAELLLAHVLGQPRVWLHTWPEHPLSEPERTRFQSLIERRAQGTPVAYLTGRCEFWSLELAVTPATLIPRPETELLVEQALARIPTGSSLRIADLGTGSGAIALAIARERPRCSIVATDRSEAALEVARRNAASHGITNVIFCSGEWFHPLQGGQFHLLLSNPPYVAEGDPHLRRGDLRFEPREALAAGTDGLDAIRLLLQEGHRYLTPGGWLLLEHGFDQGNKVRELLHRSGYHGLVHYADLQGHIRVSGGRTTL